VTSGGKHDFLQSSEQPTKRASNVNVDVAKPTENFISAE